MVTQQVRGNGVHRNNHTCFVTKLHMAVLEIPCRQEMKEDRMKKPGSGALGFLPSSNHITQCVNCHMNTCEGSASWMHISETTSWGGFTDVHWNVYRCQCTSECAWTHKCTVNAHYRCSVNSPLVSLLGFACLRLKYVLHCHFQSRRTEARLSRPGKPSSTNGATKPCWAAIETYSFLIMHVFLSVWLRTTPSVLNGWPLHEVGIWSGGGER